MKHIIWQPESNLLIDSFNNRSISADCRGGYIYKYQAAVLLSELYKVTMDRGAPRLPHESSFQYFRRLHQNTIHGDVFIISPPVITHGRRKKDVVEVGWLHLNRKDYLLLLSACDVVVNMSKIEEGWSRALLCRTPVIGSGSGGMKELLEESGQKICYTIRDFPDMVKEMITNKENYVENGYNFAKKFNYEIFAKEWRPLLREII